MEDNVRIALNFFGTLIVAGLLLAPVSVFAETTSPGPSKNPTQPVNSATSSAPSNTKTNTNTPTAAPQKNDCSSNVNGSSSSTVGFGDNLACYVSNLYNWAIGAGAALAVIILMYAGYVMTTSSGDPQKVGFAKEIIVGSLSGLALLAGAKLILNVLSAVN